MLRKDIACKKSKKTVEKFVGGKKLRSEKGQCEKGFQRELDWKGWCYKKGISFIGMEREQLLLGRPLNANAGEFWRSY